MSIYLLVTLMYWSNDSTLHHPSEFCSAVPFSVARRNTTHLGLTVSRNETLNLIWMYTTVENLITKFRLMDYLNFKNLEYVEIRLCLLAMDLEKYVARKAEEVYPINGLKEWFITQYRMRNQYITVKILYDTRYEW